jgi:hypothetical protein
MSLNWCLKTKCPKAARSKDESQVVHQRLKILQSIVQAGGKAILFSVTLESKLWAKKMD